MKTLWVTSKHHAWPLLMGSVAGYLYYRYIGCASGGCIITSHPLVSMAYGALMAVLLRDAFLPKKSTTTSSQNTSS